MSQRLGSSALAGAVLRTGLLAAAFDATAATVQYMLKGGSSPTRIWNYVASGAFGPDALTGGLHYAALGLALHVCIALIWTTLFYLVAVRMPALVKHPMLVGVAYGAFVWTMMNLVIVPSSRIGPPKSFNPQNAIIGALIIIVCIGLPIALRARRDLGPG